MILTAKPSSRGARAAFWAVVGMGALLLPLAPGLARTEAPKEPQREEAKEQVPDSGHEMLALSNPHRKLHRLTLDMQKCTSCHQAATVHSRDLQRKPQSWREAHDEIVRLMDEMRRLQSGFREAADRLPAAAESNRDEEIEKLKDEMELLKLQVRVKETRLRSAKMHLAETRRRKDSMLRQNERVPGSIARDELMTATDKLDSLTAEVDIKEVELQETQVRLKQAERRLARLQRTAEQSSQPPPQPVVHDLGTFKHGTITEMRIPISTSRGKKPLRIVSVRSSSGALSARAEKKEIEPGEKGSIIIRLDTGRFVGVKIFTVYIQFEDTALETRMQFRAESVTDTSPPSGTPKQDKQAQLKELERKLQDLLKEVRDLQHEKRPDQPRDPNQAPDSPPR